MAKRNYLVEGLSGAGKSSVYDELIRRGYRAISTDRAWKVPTGAGRSVWDERKALGELERAEPDVLFVCGSSGNRDRFLPHFTEVFNLRIDDETMRRHLRERTNNDYGKEPAEIELMIGLNRRNEKPAGAIDVDATQPLDQVVDEVLRLAGCERVASDPAPWSRNRWSFVILRDALGRETGTRIEYAWSGEVLRTLLAYLAEQGIDLVHSDHDRALVVLSPDHRERYLARLDPRAFDGAALRRYYEELNDTAADGVEYAMLDGIAFFRDTLAPLEPATEAVLIIG